MEKLDGLILIVNEGGAGVGAVLDPPPPQPVSNRIPIKGEIHNPGLAPISFLSKSGSIRTE